MFLSSVGITVLDRRSVHEEWACMLWSSSQCPGGRFFWLLNTLESNILLQMIAFFVSFPSVLHGKPRVSEIGASEQNFPPIFIAHDAFNWTGSEKKCIPKRKQLGDNSTKLKYQTYSITELNWFIQAAWSSRNPKINRSIVAISKSRGTSVFV